MLDTKTFDFRGGNALVEHTILKDIAYERDSGGKLPKTYPVEAYELYDSVLGIISGKKGVTVKPQKLIVPENSVKIFGRHDGASPLQNHKLNRHIGMFNLVTKEDSERSLGVAISSSERGIQIAFGTQVWACANQCIFGEKYMSTYGPNSMPYDKILEVLKEYMNRFQDIKKAEEEVIGKMLDVEINSEQVTNLVGELYIQARKKLLAGGASAMLTVTELGKITDAVIKVTEDNLLAEEGFFLNLWNFHDEVTRVLNPLHHADPTNIMIQNSNFTTFILNRFEIDTTNLN